MKHASSPILVPALLVAATLGTGLLPRNGAAGEATQVALTAVTAPAARASGTEGRWYSPDQVSRGQAVYGTHCAACHGVGGRGGKLGSFQVPSLDGSGHSAHHDLDYLLRQVRDGSLNRGGRMPGFAQVLGDTDLQAAIAYVQSLWPDAVYQEWQQGHATGHRH